MQSEDPTPAYRYFTIWSAAVVCLYGSGLLSHAETLEAWLCTCGSAGAVFSGGVYITAIAPFNGLGDELLTIAANVMLHVVLPLLVIGLYARQRRHLSSSVRTLMTLGLPGAYLTYSLLAAEITDSKPVYAFLDKTQFGHLGVVAAAVGGALVYTGVVWALSRIE